MANELDLESGLRLFTVTEVAQILKMNPQVVSRKLFAGDLEGYKLGKDWRVSEVQILSFLESHSNKRLSAEPAVKTVQSFFEDGKLKSIPTTRTKRLHVLRHLVSQLEYQRVYSEDEINKFLGQYHSDVCTLRREMIMNKLMVRKDGKYKRVALAPERRTT